MSKQITSLADGRYELRYAGQLVGYAMTEAEAREQLNTIAYDAERGQPTLTLVPRPDPEDDDDDYDDDDGRELLYHETAHNTFMMLDTDGGVVYQIKDRSAPVIIEPAQVVALSQFVRRSTVELAVLHTMRRLLETDPSAAMQQVLALLDANLPPLPPLPAPQARMEHLPFDDGGEYTRFKSDNVWLDFEDNGNLTLVLFNTIFDIRYDRAERWADLRALARLLTDPRVRHGWGCLMSLTRLAHQLSPSEQHHKSRAKLPSQASAPPNAPAAATAGNTPI